MRTGFKLLLAAGLAVGSVTVRAGDTYTADAVHSRIGFAVGHMMISKVRGEFQEYDATLVLGADRKIEKANATIKAASIDTGNKKRDEHLRSDDFLAAEKHPEITFETRKVEERGGQQVVLGVLTIRGVSQPVEIPTEVRGPKRDPMGVPRVGVSGMLTINRQDYGVSFSKTLDSGGLLVDNEVQITLEMEFIPSK